MFLAVQNAATYSRCAAVGAAEIRQLRWPFFLVGYSLAYFLAAKLGIATSLDPEGIVILWPPNAIVLAALVQVKREKWWILFLVTLATEIVADVPTYPLWAAAGYGVVNFSEAAIAAVLLSRFTGPKLIELRDFVRFVALGPVLASGTAALAGAVIYKIGAPEIDYLHYWRVFWLGDALGLLTIGTALLVWRKPVAWAFRPRFATLAEGAVLSSGLLAVSGWALLTAADTPRVYLIFPFLLWAALRFGVRGASVAILATTAMAIGSAVAGYGPFAGTSNINGVLGLQGLISVVALSTYMLAFSSEASLRATAELQRSLGKQKTAEEQLRVAYQDLKVLNEDLDKSVAEKTSHLQDALSRNAILIREMHHRVKNNLQIVSGILALHGTRATDPALRGRLGEVQRQICAIAATYDVLQEMQDEDVIDYCHVVPALCSSIRASSGELVLISAKTGGEAPVSADTAVAFSLALNELITNSIKHAPAGETVAIQVDCRQQGESIRLRISDDGAGFQPDFDLHHAEGFGMRMVCGIVDHAGGEVRVLDSQTGAVVEIVAPVGRP